MNEEKVIFCIVAFCFRDVSRETFLLLIHFAHRYPRVCGDLCLEDLMFSAPLIFLNDSGSSSSHFAKAFVVAKAMTDESRVNRGMTRGELTLLR